VSNFQLSASYTILNEFDYKPTKSKEAKDRNEEINR